jgi:outer membrane protein assembly factor BamB
VLDGHTLAVKVWFSAPGADFNTSPIVIHEKDRELIAAAGNDGKLYLLDAKSLGGSDHKTPLAVTPKYTAPGAGGALATWEGDGTRWILAPAVGATPAAAKFTANGVAPNGAIVAFKIVNQGGAPTLAPAWASRDLTSPLAPIVVNGLVIAASSGEYRPASGHPPASQRAQRSLPAVLYVLDAATGKELWSSGKTITSFARGGLSAGSGQVYLVTYDNQLFVFGIPMEH